MVLLAGLPCGVFRRSANVLQINIRPLIAVSALRHLSAGTAKGQPCRTCAQGAVASPALKHSCAVTLTAGNEALECLPQSHQ